MTRTLNEIHEEIRRLQEEAAAIRSRELATVIQEIKQKMTAYGITIDDLLERKVARKPVAVRFRDPVTGDEWSGRGRTPRWLAKIEANGGSRESYRVVQQ